MKGNQLRGWLVILLILISFISFSSMNYQPKHSIYNEGELGTSHLRESIDSNTNLSLSRLLISPFGLQSNPDVDLMIIIGSERSYTQAEIEAYRNFVAEGGSLIIFEDFGPAREIAETMGISYFDGMLRERNDEITVNRPTQFLVQDLTSQLFGLDFQLLLMVSEAAGISDLQGLQQGTTFPLLLTSPTTFIDKDNDNVVDQGDTQIEFGTPVGLFKQYQEGYLVVVSDASIPLNTYYQRTIEIQNSFYEIPNIFWSRLMIQTMASYMNTTEIVFDESHQQIILGSSSGVLNLIASTWVGIFNSGNIIGMIFVAVLIFTLLTNRDLYRNVINKVRKSRSSKITTNEFVSNPTLVERGLSEQYILYQRMGTKFLHIANLDLYQMIKNTDKAAEFLKNFDEKYGEITKPRSSDELLRMHKELRRYVSEELTKWL